MRERICLVCSVPITVTHLGVDVCRACAAFFKRTTLAGRSYTCTQTDGQCTFRKHEESMCQKCRHDRCLELGMEYVQPPKRRPRKKKHVLEEVRLPSLSPPLLISTRESIVRRMGNVYRSTCDCRRVREQEYAAVNQLQVVDHPTEELFIMRFTDFYEILRITVSEFTTILGKVFDEYEDFPIADQATLFKNFFGNIRFLEIFYLSSQHFSDGSNYMTSLITCVDTNNVEDWVTDRDDVERKDELRASLQGFANEYLSLIGPMLSVDKMSEREFHALLVLAFCDNVIDLPLSSETFDQLEQIRLQVLEEMQYYYRHEMKLKDISKRLANMLIVAHGAGEAGVIFYKELRLYATIFDFYANDKLIRKHLLC